MIYFLLPSSPKNAFQRIFVSTCQTEPVEAVSQSLKKYINEIKGKIAEREKEWDIYKKYTNPYEYIHSAIPHKKRSVSKYKPISRAYFKMIEMITTFNLHIPADETKPAFETAPCPSGLKKSSSFPSECATRLDTLLYEPRDSSSPSNRAISRSSRNNSCSMSRICNDEDDFRPSMDCAKRASFAPNDHRSVMKTFHLAEGPGGFIEAICNKRANLEDQYYGMTILIDDTDDNVPGWNKSSQFLSKHPNIQIERGADETGNLLHIENFDYCVHKYASSMDLITADGGFDFSKDFNKQEISIARLLWGQVCYALCLQKCGGNFVLKIFDIFYNHTIDILYILAGFYTEVNVCKLQTSRIGNSEKYVVCKGFRFENNSEFASIVRDSFSRIIEIQNLTEMNNWRIGDTRLSSSCKFRQDAEPHFAKDDATALFAAAHRTESSNAANYVWRILNFQVPRHFTKHVEDINAMFGHQQIENIHYTISLIDKHSKYDKTEQLTKQNITKCVNWCLEHKIPYYSVNSLNVFSGMESATTGI